MPLPYRENVWYSNHHCHENQTFLKILSPTGILPPIPSQLPPLCLISIIQKADIDHSLCLQYPVTLPAESKKKIEDGRRGGKQLDYYTVE